jgi:hypothetical protein
VPPASAERERPSVVALEPRNLAVTVETRPTLRWRIRGVTADPDMVMVRVFEVGAPGALEPPPADAPGRHLATFTSNPGAVPDRLELFEPGPDGILTGRVTGMTALAKGQWHRWTVVATFGRGRVRGSFLFRTRGGSEVPPAEIPAGPGDPPEGGPGDAPASPLLPETPVFPEAALPAPPPEPELPPEPFSGGAELP